MDVMLALKRLYPNLYSSHTNEYKLGLSDFTDAAMEEGKVLKNGIELVKSVSDKHLDLLRPSSRYFSMFKGSRYPTIDVVKIIT